MEMDYVIFESMRIGCLYVGVSEGADTGHGWETGLAWGLMDMDYVILKVGG